MRPLRPALDLVSDQRGPVDPKHALLEKYYRLPVFHKFPLRRVYKHTFRAEFRKTRKEKYWSERLENAAAPNTRLQTDDGASLVQSASLSAEALCRTLQEAGSVVTAAQRRRLSNPLKDSSFVRLGNDDRNQQELGYLFRRVLQVFLLRFDFLKILTVECLNLKAAVVCRCFDWLDGRPAGLSVWLSRSRKTRHLFSKVGGNLRIAVLAI